MKISSLVLFSSVALVSCAAPDKHPSVDVSLAYASEYVFRGATQNEKGAVQGEVSTAIEMDGGTAFVTFWGHVDPSNDTGDAVLPDGNGGKFSEIDTVAGYSFDLQGVSMEVGVMGYQFPNAVGGSTNELYVTAAKDDYRFSPSLSAYYDFDEVEGGYLQGALSHGFDVGEDLTLDLGLSLGWSSQAHSNTYYGVSEAGVADLGASVGLNYSPEEGPSYGLSLTNSSLIDSDLNDALEDGGIDGDTLYLVLSISRSY
jgi:uncharacterized protein (TIGR02001 family)